MTRKVHQRTIRVAGLKLHVEESGSGHPVLLINGLGAHTEMWEPLRQALGNARIIAFDAPGTGRSATAPLPCPLPVLAGFAETVLERSGESQADVLGYSLGGTIAQELARRSPEAVRRLVLVATTPGWGGVLGTLGALALVSTPVRYYSRFVYERTIGSLAGGQARTDHAWVRRIGEARLKQPPNPWGYLWQMLAATAWSSLPWLHTLPHPTLVVSGDDDPLVPLGNSTILAHRIPQARLFVAPGEGHLLLSDRTSAALPVIRSFLCAADHTRGWAKAIEVDARAAADALRQGGPGGRPLGTFSALVRSLYPPRAA